MHGSETRAAALVVLAAALSTLATAPSRAAAPGGQGPSCVPSGEVVRVDLSTGQHVFDFEDGVQGWSLCGSAVRTSTSGEVVEGSWSVFGDGLAGVPFPPTVDGGAAYVTLDIEPNRDVERIDLDLLFLGTYTDLVPDDVVRAQLVATGDDGFDIVVGGPQFLAPDAAERALNPGRRTLDIPESILGKPLTSVLVSWRLGGCITVPPSDVCLGLDDPDRLRASIDNVTFVPEPAGQTAVALSVLALLSRRSRHRGRQSGAA